MYRGMACHAPFESLLEIPHVTLSTPSILLITGIMAAGKSTIAQAVAVRLPKSVHLRGDIFRRMIVNGQAAIDPDLSDAAMAQLRLRYQIAAAAAEQYTQAGFTVVYQDVILGPILADVIDMLRFAPLYVIVLCPSPEVTAQRDLLRHKVAYESWTPHALDEALRQNTPRLALWLDNSNLSVQETVDTIFSQLDLAFVKPSSTEHS